MEKNLYIDASHPEETRIVLKSTSSIEEYEYEDKNNLNFKNNIYLGTISRVEPSLQAAFVNFGRQRHGFLAFNDIQSDYYQVPSEDKEKIKNVEEKIREDLKNTNIDEVNSNQDTDENDSKILNDVNDGNSKTIGDNENQVNSYIQYDKSNELDDLSVEQYENNETIYQENSQKLRIFFQLL